MSYSDLKFLHRITLAACIVFDCVLQVYKHNLLYEGKQNNHTAEMADSIAMYIAAVKHNAKNFFKKVHDDYHFPQNSCQKFIYKTVA